MPPTWPHSIGSDGLIRISGLRDQLTGDYVNDADIDVIDVMDSVTLQTLPGFSGPVSLSYRVGTNGDYYGTLASGVAVKEGQRFLLQVVATSGGMQKTFWIHAQGAKS